MALSSGTRLGPYEIGPQLGAGGMGEVYRAKDARLKRDVAIKVLPATYSTDADRLRRFEREAPRRTRRGSCTATLVHRRVAPESICRVDLATGRRETSGGR